MAQRNPRLWENSHFREVVGTVAVLAVLLMFTGMTLRSIIPMAILVGGVVGHDIADERYDLPDGTNLLVYGTTVVITGAYLTVLGGMWVGGFLALVGCWFVFDGATSIRYGASRTTYEYVSDLDNEMGETMLRMQTLNVVYQALKEASEPQTPEGLATDLDLTKSRVKRALGFLESEGRIEQIANQYRAEQPRWGRVIPIVQFLVWFSRRVVRPFYRVAANI